MNLRVMVTRQRLIIPGWLLVQICLIWVFTRLAFRPTFPYYDQILEPIGPRWLTTWANFDGVHYLTIVEKGYVGTGLIQAFFPFYPLIIKMLTWVGLKPLLAGLIVSWISWSGAMVLLDKLFASKWLFWLVLAFPTAFFFLAYYTESLFLCLSLLSLYWAKKRRWGWAGLAGMAAGLTRLPGIFLSILIWDEVNKAKVKKKPYGSILMPCLGLVIYMVYLGVTFSNPLLFLTVQREFGAQRSQGWLVPLITPLYRYGKILLTVNPASPAYYICIQELLLTLGAGWLVLRLWQKGEIGYSLYSFSCLILPTLTGTLSSMPRYTLVIFPLFWELDRSVKGKWRLLILAVFAILQVINLALFTQGKWVA